MAVEVTQNLTEITISQVGIQGPKGEKGDSGEIQDVSGLTTTSSFNEFTQSVDTHILGISTYTGSNESWKDGIRDELSYLEAWTASLDMEYATDEQLYQLYQSTASIHFTTQSLNEQTGSQDLVNLGISIVSGSINSQTSSQDNVNFGISIVTSSIDNHILGVSTQTGSQDLVNLGISTFTGSQNVINTSVDNHILDISTYTGSNELWKGGIRGEVNGIEAYTSSLKGAIEISGQDVNVLGMITAQQYNVTYVSSSVQYQSGSTEFGDTADDTHIFTGTVILNGDAIGMGELNAQTASQNTLNTSLGLITSSIYDEISSIDNHILGISTQTGSQDLVNLGISFVTGSFNSFTESIEGRVSNLQSVTGSYLTSLNGTISSSQQITDFGFISESVEIPLGTISGSSQLTSSFDERYTLSGSIQPLPDGLISGSSQLTSSFDERYAISASYVSSTNIESIQTITSASYAALTPPVSGTLYIII